MAELNEESFKLVFISSTPARSLTHHNLTSLSSFYWIQSCKVQQDLTVKCSDLFLGFILHVLSETQDTLDWLYILLKTPPYIVQIFTCSPFRPPPPLPPSPILSSVLILPFSLTFPVSSQSLFPVPFLPRPFNVALPHSSSLTFSPCNLFLLNHLLSAHSFLDQTTSCVESKCHTKSPTYMVHYLLDISWWLYLQEWTPVVSLISIPMCPSSCICYLITCIHIQSITFPKVWIESLLYVATGKFELRKVSWILLSSPLP